MELDLFRLRSIYEESFDVVFAPNMSVCDGNIYIGKNVAFSPTGVVTSVDSIYRQKGNTK